MGYPEKFSKTISISNRGNLPSFNFLMESMVASFEGTELFS
jgi:hypothetical protein